MSNKPERAKALFLDKKNTGLNCAQAVLKVFQPESGMTDEQISSYSSAGGGRAEGGVCGAYHAAAALIQDSSLMNELMEQFVTNGGSVVCKKIRKLKTLPCGDCVQLAAEFVEKHITPA